MLETARMPDVVLQRCWEEVSRRSSFSCFPTHDQPDPAVMSMIFYDMFFAIVQDWIIAKSCGPSTRHCRQTPDQAIVKYLSMWISIVKCSHTHWANGFDHSHMPQPSTNIWIRFPFAGTPHIRCLKLTKLIWDKQ